MNSVWSNYPNFKINFLVTFGIILLFSSFVTANAETIHVPGDQPTIQAGINAAGDGDTVLVAPGTYTGTGNINIDFKGKAVSLRSENGPDVTVIDCKFKPNSLGIFFHSYESNSSRLDGFTIKNGFAFYGGGIFCLNSSPNISNCIITNNTVSYDGGGIYCENSSPILDNCIINNNFAGFSAMFTGTPNPSNGGGIYCKGSNIKINNCTIDSNKAYECGAGICLLSSWADITGSTISNNRAKGIVDYEDGGGIWAYMSSGTMTNCKITKNQSDRDGGGIYWRNNNVTIKNCTISENHSFLYGGGIYFFESAPVITNCSFVENDSQYSGGGINAYHIDNGFISDSVFINNRCQDNGGAMYCDSAAFAITNSIFAGNTALNGGAIGSQGTLRRSFFTNCIISGNKSSNFGGGIYCDYSSPVFNCCTIAGNMASSKGGAIYGEGSPITLVNSIVWGNMAQQGMQLWLPNSLGVDISFSDIQNGEFGAENSIASDPLFRNPMPATYAPTIYGDYHLTEISPCIDHGTSADAPNFDIEYDERPFGFGVDMGADEFKPLIQYQLDILKEGDGTGVVTSSPDGINCGNECTAPFKDQMLVTLTAKADPGSIFVGWSGDCSGTDECQVLMNQDRTVTAIFSEDMQVNLRPFQPSEWSDKIVVANVTDTTDDSPVMVSSDQLYVDFAVINDGSVAIDTDFYIDLFIDSAHVNSWHVSSLQSNQYVSTEDYPIGKLVPGTHTLELRADSTESVMESNELDNYYTKTITIVPANYTLTISASTLADAVSITSSPPDLTGLSGGETVFSLTYSEGTDVTLTAPSTWNVLEFSGWIGCDADNGPVCYVTMESNCTITAEYKFPPEDNDMDGLPDAFEAFYDIDTGGEDSIVDFDGDGFCNLREYLYVSNPADHMDIPPVIGDHDTDSDVDGMDIQAIATVMNNSCLTSDPKLCFYDFNKDNKIDGIDLRFFAEDFGR